MTMDINTYPWDITEHLDSEEAIAVYLDEAMQAGDNGYLPHAISNVARARDVKLRERA